MVVSLIPEEPFKKGEVSLEPQTQEPTSDPVATADDVERTDYALGAESPGADTINAYYQTNKAEVLRDQTVAQQQLADRRARQAFVADAANRAALEGRTLTQEDYAMIQSVASGEIVGNRDTIFERMYSNRIAREALEENTQEQLEAEEEAPETAKAVRFTAEDYYTKQEIAKRYIQSLNTVYQQNGLLSNAWDFGRQFVPFYSALSQTGESGVNQDALGGRFLNPGGTKAAEYQALFFLPPEEFDAALRAKVDDIRGNSTLEALVWVQGLLDYTTSNAAIDTAFNLVDVAGFGLPALTKMAKTARSIAKTNNVPLNKTARLVVTGNTEQAAREAAFTRINSKVSPTTKVGVQTGTPKPVVQSLDLMKKGPGLLDPTVPVRDPGTLSNEAARRLVEGLTQDTGTLLGTLDDVTNLVRIPEAAFAAGVYKAEQRFFKQYAKLEDAVLEILPVRESEEVFGGVDNIRVVLGKQDATPFKTESNARYFAEKTYRLPKGEYEVVQGAGNNWFITIRKNIDETEREVLDLRIATDNRNPENLVNQFIGAIRTPDDLLSKEHNAARKTATYGGNAILNRIRQVAENIGSLPKKELNDLSTMISHARFEWRPITLPDGTQSKVQGKFYDTVADLESAYMARFKRVPTEKEIRAYYAFRNISDLDYLQRNIAVLRDKSRIGLEEINVSASVPVGEGQYIYKNLDAIEGKIIDSLPPDNAGTYGLAWVDDKSGKMKFGLSDRLFPGDRKAITEALDTGKYKIVHVYNPNDPVLRALNVGKGEGINYLLVKDLKTKPLKTEQIPYVEGGHWNHGQNNVYVKQAVTHKSAFGRRIYTGDKTAFSFAVPKMAREHGEAMEQARLMLVRGAPKPEITAFVSKNLPFADADEFASQFRNADTNPDGPFDLNTPFVVTQTGQAVSDVRRLDDVFGETVVTGDDAHSLAPKVNTTYNETEPVYGLGQSQVLDPMESLQRASASMSSDRFFEDYKHISIENWAKQFSDVVDVNQAQLMANPLKYLLDPKWMSNVDPRHLAAAQNSRRAILQFLGQDTKESLAWKWLRQKAVDSLNPKGGKNGKIIEPWMWTKETDPADMARTAVFHAKLGMFNPVQFFTQASGAIHAMAIDGNPVRSVQSVFAYWAMRMQQMAPDGGKWAGVNAKISKALGIPTDVLDDMYLQWNRSGMNVVEGEYGILDDYLNPKMFEGKTGRALDAGTIFFKEGNNVHRGTSFALSYLKWRQANPLAKVKPQDLQAMVDRADLMYINMSRASNSMLQNPNSITSVPMQFFGYHVRMTEQLLGKRLTWPEKLRLFGTYSLMWGVPVGIGGTTLGAFWPVRESTRQYALEHGMDIDGNVASKVFMDGLGSLLVQWATGENYDVASRFGPGGMSWLKDIMDGNLTEAFGAGPNFIGQLVETTKPFVHAMGSVFNTDPASGYGLKVEDFVDVLKNISTFNNMTKAYAVYNTGQWLTKSQGVVGNVKNDLPNIVAIALGLTPQQVQDAYLMLDSVTKEEESQAAITREAMVNFRRGLKAANARNSEEMKSFFSRARWLLIASGMSPLDAGKVFQRALRENESMITQIGEDFMMNDPEVRRENFKQSTMEQMNNG
jgi:hypothetical protein